MGNEGVCVRSLRSRALRQAGEQVTASPRIASKVLRQFAQTSLFMSQIMQIWDTTFDSALAKLDAVAQILPSEASTRRTKKRTALAPQGWVLPCAYPLSASTSRGLMIKMSSAH